VTSQLVLRYRVSFENEENAGAAQRIDITDQLDPLLDWSTLELAEVGFGDIRISIPSGSQFFRTSVPYAFGGISFQVDIEVSLRPGTGELYARFLAIDPLTGLPPTANVGVLAPEDGTGRGQGFISYRIRPDAGLASGTVIRNIAIIQFDSGEIIATNQIDPHDPSKGTDPLREAFVTIDAGLPSSSVNPLPAQVAGSSFLVSWMGIDDLGGAGVALYDIFVSTDGGPFEPFLIGTPETSAVFTGEPTRTYAFYSVATDGVGHREPTPAGAQAQTMTGDLLLAITGAPTSVEGSSYTLSLSANGTDSQTLSAWTIDWGDGVVQTIPGQPVSATHVYGDGPLTAIIRASATLSSGDYIANELSIQVVNIPPIVEVGSDAFVLAGGTFARVGTISDAGLGEVYTATVNYGDGSGEQALPVNSDRTFLLSHLYSAPGSYQVTVSVWDTELGSDSLTVVVNPPTNLLAVESLLAQGNTLEIRFNQEIDPVPLNLYDNEAGVLGPADVIVWDSQAQPLVGSLVVHADHRGVTFRRSSGPLAAGIHQLMLRGAVNGFRGLDGLALDGDGDQQPGGDFQTSVNVTAASNVHIAAPQILRGPGQETRHPGGSSSFPITISNGAGVHGIDLTLRFDPQSLAVASASFGPLVPADWDFAMTQPEPGRVVLTANGFTPLSAGAGLEMFEIFATVPATASYASKQLLDLEGVTITDFDGNTIASTALDGLHVVGFSGDASGNGFVSSLDVTQLRRWIGGLDSGFVGYQLIDPRLIGDTNLNGFLNAGDVTILRRFITGLDQPFIPSIPGGVTITPAGLDPRIWLPQHLVVSPGDVFRVPLLFEQTDTVAIPFGSFDAAIQFDSSLFTLLAIEPGSLAPRDEFLVYREDGLVAISAAAIDEVLLDSGTTGELAWLTFSVNPRARHGSSSPLNLLDSAPSATRGTLPTLAGDGRLILTPAPTNSANDPVDGMVTIKKRSGRKESNSLSIRHDNLGLPMTQPDLRSTSESLEINKLSRSRSRKIAKR
jgi:hypothetical protein